MADRLSDLREMRDALKLEIERLQDSEVLPYEARGRDVAGIVKELRAVIAEIAELDVVVEENELTRMRARHAERRGNTG